MQKQHDTQIHNLREMHRQELDMKEKELSRLARIIDKAFRWFPMFREMLRMEKFCAMQGFSKELTERLVVRKEAMRCSGKIYSEQHRRNFDVKDDVLRVENAPDDENKLNLTINTTGSGNNGTGLDTEQYCRNRKRKKAKGSSCNSKIKTLW